MKIFNKNNIFGRDKEIEQIQECIETKKSVLFAIYGRRRVGKTYLINNVLSEHKNYLKLTGAYNSSPKMILSRINKDIIDFTKTNNIPIKVNIENWNDFFFVVEDLCLIFEERKEKFILFIDELPWFADKRGEFLTAFTLSWNQKLSSFNHFKMFISGSATTWIVKKVLNDKGGLHRRITHSINLKPFNFDESCEYLNYYGSFSKYHLFVLYFIFGGVPYYLSLYDFKQTIEENVKRLFNNQLKDEFKELTSSLFSLKGIHQDLIKFLLTARTREEILNNFKEKSHQTILNNLEELILCGFVKELKQFNNKNRNNQFKVCDCFLYFYLKTDINKFNIVSNEFNKWCGFAFEIFLINQIDFLKNLLGIKNVETIEYSWNSLLDKNHVYEKHCQIDLIVERKDKIIHLIEAKFYDSVFVINNDYRENLLNKRKNFIQFLEYKKQNKKEVNIMLISLLGSKYNGEKPLNYIDVRLE